MSMHRPNRSERDIASLALRYSRGVHAFFLRRVRDRAEADDLTQDVFLKIFKSLNTFDRRANFQTWLISVSRNLCIDHYRSVRKERETMNRDVDPAELTPASTTVSPYARIELRDRVGP